MAGPHRVPHPLTSRRDGRMPRLERAKRTLGVAALSLAALVATAAPPDDPLRMEDLVRFLRAGVSERTILAEIQARGVAEPVDAAVEDALRDAGATENLVESVRAAAPAQVPQAEAPPPGMHPQAPPATGASAPRLGPVFGVSTRRVRLPVSVTDKEGRPVTGLKEADFRVLEDGRPQEIAFFSGERKPLRVAVALDLSGSMQDKIDEVADSLKHFVDLLERDDEVLVMTFSDQPRLIQDFTSDRRRLGRVLEALRPGGGTALYDAVIEATERVAAGPAESKAVVLVTDGKDTGSTASFKEAREAARRSEVPVYSIGIGHEAGFGEVLGRVGGIHVGSHGRGGSAHGGFGESDFDPRPLLDLADETGARAEILKGLEHHHTGKVDRLKDAAESIALTLRYRYLLAYDPAETGSSGWRKIRVEVDRTGVQVRARKGYYSGPQS